MNKLTIIKKFFQGDIYIDDKYLLWVILGNVAVLMVAGALILWGVCEK